MTIKIYQPSNSPMQSGLRKTKQWVAEYVDKEDKLNDQTDEDTSENMLAN